MDILKREKEFQKLNEELDRKTRNIIEKSSGLPSTTAPINHKTIKSDDQAKESEKDDAKRRLFHKANTIPKRFRDSLTNRKIKENKTVEVNEKSIQISENELNNANEENDTHLEDQVQEENTQIEINEDKTHAEELIETTYSNFKEEIKQKILPKANTVPKRNRDSLKNIKAKDKLRELNENLFQQTKNEFKIKNIEGNTELGNDILNENESQTNSVSEIPANSSTLSKTKNSTNSTKSIKNYETDSSSSKSLKTICITSDSLTSKKNLSAEGLVKFLKSKVSILEVELSNTKNEIAKQAKELEVSYEMQQKFEVQRDQAISKNNTLTEQVEKINEKSNELEKKMKDREMEISNSKRDSENLKREIKVLNQTNKNLEKRLYRSNEDLENSKSNLESVKKNERNYLETARIDKEKLEKQIKDLKRQRNEFLNAYKKQLFLIDNLKRQNTCMEQCQIIGLGEKQFSKILDLNKE